MVRPLNSLSGACRPCSPAVPQMVTRVRTRAECPPPVFQTSRALERCYTSQTVVRETPATPDEGAVRQAATLVPFRRAIMLRTLVFARARRRAREDEAMHCLRYA